ncbi:hypothetical protein D3C87_2010460 [compost metagenome]
MLAYLVLEHFAKIGAVIIKNLRKHSQFQVLIVPALNQIGNPLNLIAPSADVHLLRNMLQIIGHHAKDIT